MKSQLWFPFAQDAPAAGPSRSTLYWQKRIDRAVRAAFEIGRRQRKPAPQPRSVGAAQMSSRLEPSRDEGNELLDLAARLSRLTIDRKNPFAFHEEKSELVFELRQIARRSGVTGAPPSGSWRVTGAVRRESRTPL
jgi:hypothetical protein